MYVYPLGIPKLSCLHHHTPFIVNCLYHIVYIPCLLMNPWFQYVPSTSPPFSSLARHVPFYISHHLPIPAWLRSLAGWTDRAQRSDWLRPPSSAGCGTRQHRSGWSGGISLCSACEPWIKCGFPMVSHKMGHLHGFTWMISPEINIINRSIRL